MLMPELPEVETTRRGIEPLVADKVVVQVIIYNGSLRWAVPGPGSRRRVYA